jgi:maleamate amidohydrolase
VINDELAARFGAIQDSYRASGMGSRVGFGAAPALVVVDFSYGFTDTSCPLGSELGPELAATRTLLDAARAQAVPVIFLSVGYQADGSDGGPFMAKCPSLRQLVLGSRWCEIDERLARREDEPVLMKKVASGFIGTDLDTRLHALGADTVVLTGTSTSGCVRATAVDACSYGYRTIVVADGVGDRSDERHWASLFDLDSKYADVLDLAAVLTALVGA